MTDKLCGPPLTPTKYARTVEAQYWLISYAFHGSRGDDKESHWFPVAVSADSEESARKHAEWLWKQLNYDCIRITGPHKQEIPA